jgi:hypothetical protein
MTDSILKDTQALRDKAWAAVTSSPAYASFKALDVAVVQMGGQSMLSADSPIATASAVNPPLRRRLKIHSRTRPSQGDVALSCLRQSGVPVNIRDLMQQVIERGVEINGADPLANFRSTLSRDDRFKSIMKDGGYFWWMVDSPVPRSWKEAESPDLLDQPSASNSTSQEGGDADAATMS